MINFQEIKNFSLFTDLSESQLQKIAEVGELKTYKAREVIFKEYTQANCFFVLKNGHVAIDVEVGKGKKSIVSTITPGNLFGWSALVSPYIWTATAVAVDPSEVFAFHGKRVNELFKEDPLMASLILKQILTVVSTRLRDSQLQLINLINWPLGEPSSGL